MNLSSFVGCEIMTVIHVEGWEETKGWAALIYNGELIMAKPDPTSSDSPFFGVHDSAGRPYHMGELFSLHFEGKGRKRTQFLEAWLSDEEKVRFRRGCGPGEAELFQKAPPAATLTVIGRGGEPKLVQSYIPEVKVGDLVVVSRDRAAMRAPSAPPGRVVSLSENLSNGKVLTIDGGDYRTALLAGGLTYQKDRKGILDFTGNVIVKFLDK